MFSTVLKRPFPSPAVCRWLPKTLSRPQRGLHPAVHTSQGSDFSRAMGKARLPEQGGGGAARHSPCPSWSLSAQDLQQAKPTKALCTLALNSHLGFSKATVTKLASDAALHSRSPSPRPHSPCSKPPATRERKDTSFPTGASRKGCTASRTGFPWMMMTTLAEVPT